MFDNNLLDELKQSFSYWVLGTQYLVQIISSAIWLNHKIFTINGSIFSVCFVKKKKTVVSWHL